MIREARLIYQEIKDAVIIGAVAVMLQTKRSRTSHDVDIATSTHISRDVLIESGYIPIDNKRDSWYSPRGIKVDIYRKDVSGIPISEIVKTATTIHDSKKIKIKVASLEVLIIAKYRSYNNSKRPNDREDMKTIVQTCLKKIDCARLERLCTDNLEYKEITKMLRNLEKFG